MSERPRIHSTSEDSTTIRVSLVLRDFDVPPTEITRQLGITPSRAASQGDPVVSVTGRMTSHLHKHAVWSLASGMPPSTPLEQQVRSLLDSVQTAAAALRAIKAPTVKQIYCTVIPGGAIPVLALQSETMRRVADLGLDLVIDILYVDLEEH